MMPATDVLDRLALAHALLAAGRTKFALARDETQLPVAVEAPEATRFCVVGAVERAAFEMGEKRDANLALVMLTDTHIERCAMSLINWHDTRATKKQALALLEECAARINPK